MLHVKKLKNYQSNQKKLIECVVTKGIIKQEYAVNYDFNYNRCNYRRCEKVQEIDYFR